MTPINYLGNKVGIILTPIKTKRGKNLLDANRRGPVVAPEKMSKSRVIFIGALLLLLMGLWWFLRPPDKSPPPITSGPAPTAPKTMTNSLGMKFVLIPAGTFQMGSGISPEETAGKHIPHFYKNSPKHQALISSWFTHEHPQHQVIMNNPFYLQTTEVTQGQWQKVMDGNPSRFKECGEDCPVEGVFWNEAQEFIKKLNRMEDTDRYRLPTEAEWEYACRAGSTSVWCFGDNEADLGEYAWYEENSGEKEHPVGQLTPNAWGLYDMHGNVSELCQDRYEFYPAGPFTELSRFFRYRLPNRLFQREKFTDRDPVLRGGSYCDPAVYLRSASRSPNIEGFGRASNIGFRVARTLDLPKDLKP